ncbi:MAG TPA: hypothetical protein VGI35_01705 [Steroidobacteraceae bacterium]
MRGPRFGVEGLDSAPPRLALARHLSRAIAVLAIDVQLAIDQLRDGNGGPVRRLRRHASRDRAHGLELVDVEEARLLRSSEPLVDDVARLLVPRRRVALREHVVPRVALWTVLKRGAAP